MRSQLEFLFPSSNILIGLHAMPQTMLDSRKLTNGFRDSAFAKNKELPLHRWVPWIAGFSAEFVQDCLTNYLGRKDVRASWVLDPFAGVGTTLVEAYVRGFNVVGFEINPYAALATKIKLEAPTISIAKLEKQIDAFERFMERHCDSNGRNGRPRSQPPAGFSGRTQLFSPKVERKILFALDFINSISDLRIRDVFRLALGAVMVSVSNYSYEPSLTRRLAVGKVEIDDAPVGETVLAKLDQMLCDVKWVQGRMNSQNRVPTHEVFPSSIFYADRFVSKDKFVDLVVTSPPYLNNYHYPRNTRPQLHWLGFASGRGYRSAGENDSFGKFWQTVRDLPPVPVVFDLRRLKEDIAAIRSRNTEKGIYGGRGWANYVTTYFNDAFRFCKVLVHLLRPRGAAIIVLGNSIIQGVEIPTDRYFGKIAELCGLKFEETLLLRKKRTGSSIIQSSVRANKASARTVLYESAIVLRK